MKRLLLVLVFFGILCGISGCGSTINQQRRSTFYSTFSIGEIVAKNDRYLLPEPRNLSGTETGPAAPPYQKHEEMIVQIDPADISGFMEAVKTDIQQAILNSGAKIEGQSDSLNNQTDGQIDDISFRYSQNEASGVINLYGVRGERTDYIIIVVLTES